MLCYRLISQPTCYCVGGDWEISIFFSSVEIEFSEVTQYLDIKWFFVEISEGWLSVTYFIPILLNLFGELLLMWASSSLNFKTSLHWERNIRVAKSLICLEEIGISTFGLLCQLNITLLPLLIITSVKVIQIIVGSLRTMYKILVILLELFLQWTNRLPYESTTFFSRSVNYWKMT